MGKNANKITHVDLEDVQHEEVEGALMEDGHKALHPGDYRKFHERLYYENEIIPHVSGPPPRRVKLSDEQVHILNRRIEKELVPRTYLGRWWGADYDTTGPD